MAKRPATPRPPDPVAAALAAMSALIGKGAAPDRVRRGIEATLDAWAAEAPDAYRDRLEALRAELDTGVEAAAETVADMDTGEVAALRAAHVTLAALTASLDAVVAALAGGPR